MSHEKQLAWLLSLPALALLVFLGFVPLFVPIISRHIGTILPVVTNVEVDVIAHDEDGLLVDVTFDKVRACEFLGISWYDSLGDRVHVLFDPNNEGDSPFTRPVKDRQNAGPWKLIGLDALDGTVAITSHRCNPFWITYTHFYP